MVGGGSRFHVPHAVEYTRIGVGYSVFMLGGGWFQH